MDAKPLFHQETGGFFSFKGLAIRKINKGQRSDLYEVERNGNSAESVGRRKS
jgi:hypothetical protein